MLGSYVIWWRLLTLFSILALIVGIFGSQFHMGPGVFSAERGPIIINPTPESETNLGIVTTTATAVTITSTMTTINNLLTAIPTTTVVYVIREFVDPALAERVLARLSDQTPNINTLTPPHIDTTTYFATTTVTGATATVTATTTVTATASALPMANPYLFGIQALLNGGAVLVQNTEFPCRYFHGVAGNFFQPVNGDEETVYWACRSFQRTATDFFTNITGQQLGTFFPIHRIAPAAIFVGMIGLATAPTVLRLGSLYVIPSHLACFFSDAVVAGLGSEFGGAIAYLLQWH